MSAVQIYRLEVSGGLLAVLRRELTARFDDIEMTTTGNDRLAITGAFDQSALRALLQLIWDVGGTAVFLMVTPADRPGEDRKEYTDDNRNNDPHGA